MGFPFSPRKLFKMKLILTKQDDRLAIRYKIQMPRQILHGTFWATFMILSNFFHSEKLFGESNFQWKIFQFWSVECHVLKREQSFRRQTFGFEFQPWGHYHVNFVVNWPSSWLLYFLLLALLTRPKQVETAVHGCNFLLLVCLCRSRVTLST